MFHLFKKKEKIKRELPPGTIRKEFHFEGNVQNIGFVLKYKVMPNH